MRTMYIGLGLLGFFFHESWDSHWDRCYKCIIRCSQFTVCVCFPKGLWLVRRGLGQLLVLPGSYTLLQARCWEGRGSSFLESTKLGNAAALQGTKEEAMGHEDENRRLEKSREPYLRDNRQTFLETTGDHKDPSKKGEKQEALTLQEQK